jgi:hypothetical protein
MYSSKLRGHNKFKGSRQHTLIRSGLPHGKPEVWL